MDQALLLVGVGLLALVAGATAAVVGFGIGSILTPILVFQLDATLAVAAVAVPHAVASALRAWRLRDAIDWAVIRRFGVVSAAGGIAGGLLYSVIADGTLTVALAVLLLATSAAGLTGWTERWRPRGPAVTALGALSGLFGGIAGNQGGLRASALLAFGLGPAAFVATSTMTGLLVDAARTPLYLWRAGGALLEILPLICVATLGVVAGTFAGERVLLGLTRVQFRRTVSVLIGLLGLSLLAAGA